MRRRRMRRRRMRRRRMRRRRMRRRRMRRRKKKSRSGCSGCSGRGGRRIFVNRTTEPKVGCSYIRLLKSSVSFAHESELWILYPHLT
jgi:hypothetical protein